mgnify:CR=1 FL=1
MDLRGLVALSNSRSFDWGTMPTTARFPQVETDPQVGCYDITWGIEDHLGNLKLHLSIVILIS